MVFFMASDTIFCFVSTINVFGDISLSVKCVLFAPVQKGI